MVQKNEVSLRKIAQLSGFSVATVSGALRGDKRVREATHERILAIATQLGYKIDPRVSEAMSVIRMHGGGDIRGTVAMVDIIDRGRDQIHPFHLPIISGIRERSGSLGYQAELFIVGNRDQEYSLLQLRRIFHSRGIVGVVVLPFSERLDFSGLQLESFAAVSMDFSLIHPRLHRVLPDHYSAMQLLLKEASNRGYQCPGLFIDCKRDARIDYRWSASFLAYHIKPPGFARDSIPPLLIGPEEDQEAFVAWFEDHQPDLVISHSDQCCEWLKDRGVAVPATVGFFSLNRVFTTPETSGFDLNPEELGRVAIASVIGQINRGEKSPPANPQSIQVPCRWVDGTSMPWKKRISKED